MRRSIIQLLALGLTSCAVTGDAGIEERSYPRKAEEVWAAALSAVRDLDLKVDSTLGDRIEARRPEGGEVTVEVRTVQPETTLVYVRADPGLTKLIFDRIAVKLGARGVPTP